MDLPFNKVSSEVANPKTEKQIQPKIHMKTVELSEVEKEAIRLKIRVMKIQRALNRPLLN